MSEDKKVVKRITKDSGAVLSDKETDKLENETEQVLVSTSEANKIWQEIKDAPIELFSLPRQIVSMHAKPIDIEPSACYVELATPAAFPALEKLLGVMFDVEQVDRFIKITRKV